MNMAGNDIIAIDLGGTNLRGGLVRNNKILKYVKKQTPKQKNMLIKELLNIISELMKNSKNVKGIGIACPGPLKDGIIKNPPNLPLRNFNLKKIVQQKFRVRVEVEKDSTCVALAEAKLGCKKKNFFILTLGTGIGGGIIINGSLYDGQGYGGELGNIVLDHGECFENLAAWKGTKKLTKKYFGKEILINELMRMKDKRAGKILEQVTGYLGQGIASLINIFDPEIVVLAGGVRETGQGFLNMIKKQTKKYILLPRTTEIIWTKLTHPGTLGASLLIK